MSSEQSNALTLLGLNYESSSETDEEIEVEVIEDDEKIENSDEIQGIVKSTLDQMIDKICSENSFNSWRNSNKISSASRRNRNDSEIEISSSSSSSWSLSSDDDLEEDEHTNKIITKKPSYVKTKGELTIDDLPPIENLSIQLQVEELTQIGRVVSIMDKLIVIQSFKGLPALDLESYLFFKDGSSLGSIFDVFGPVIEPRYSIRFNNNEEITEKNIHVDMPVYFAANHQKPITSYVFVAQLLRFKGSDASWKHNNEPPEDVKEYSDDEEERRDKQKQRAKTRHRKQNPKPFRNHFNRNFHSNYSVPQNTPNNSFQQNQFIHNWFAHPHSKYC